MISNITSHTSQIKYLKYFQFVRQVQFEISKYFFD